MNPYPPPRQNLEYQLPAKGQSDIPIWKGDKIFVMVEILTALLSFLIVGLMLGSFLDAMRYSRTSSGDMQMVKSVFTVLIVIGLAMYIPIIWFRLLGIWKGKQWSYIFTVCLLSLSALIQIYRVASGSWSSFPDLQVLTMISMILGISKLAFCGMRLSGNTGPPLH